MSQPFEPGRGMQSLLARELIQAGRAERASATARELAGGALASAASSATVKAAWLTMTKWLVVSSLVVVAGGLAWHAASRGGEARVPAQPSIAEPLASSFMATATVAPSNSSAPPSVPTPTRELRTTKPTAPSAASLAAKPQTVASASSLEQPRDQRLRQEIDALRAAREALARGAGQQALKVLDARQGGFEHLAVEAAIVRVQALRQSGDEPAARALATTLLRQHASGPYAERLRDLLP